MKVFLANILRRALGPLGFEVHLSAMRTTMTEALAHIKRCGFKPATVIDVGAANGTPELYEAFPASVHLLVEPLREYEKALRAICSRYSAQYVLAAAADKVGTTTLSVQSVLQTSSMLDYAMVPQGCPASREVPTVTLDVLCKDRGLAGPFLIKVDTQGSELKVIAGAANVLKETEYVILEVSLGEYLRGGPQLCDVVVYMKSLGFAAYDVFGGWLSAADGALAQVDMAFVKEHGRFRRPISHRLSITPTSPGGVSSWSIDLVYHGTTSKD